MLKAGVTRRPLLIGQVCWPTPDGLVAGAVRLEHGRITLLPDAPPTLEADVDGGGGLLLPGLIDPHTHLREPGQARLEGIANGTRAALKGGVTTVMDMPNDRPPTTTAERLRLKAARFAAKSRVHYGLHLQASDRLVDPASAPMASAKLYMARSSSEVAGIPQEERVRRTLAAYRRVMVHAEDERRFAAPRAARGRAPFRHHEDRPREAVSAALQTLEAALRSLPAAARPRVILAHAATAEEARWVGRMKEQGFDVRGETCPHYLFLTQADHEARGSLYQVNPPIRAAADRAALRQALADGTLDFLSSDHAPHALARKADLQAPPSGIAGIEWMAPLLMELVEEGTLPLGEVSRVGAEAAAAAFDLGARGQLRDGADADLVLLTRRPLKDAAAGRTAPALSRACAREQTWVRGADARRAVVSRAGTDPYAHLGLRWEVAGTWISGALSYWLGRFSRTRGPIEEVFR